MRKICRRCEHTGNVNGDALCGNCDEEPCSQEWKEDEKENVKMKEELKMVKQKNAEIDKKMVDIENKWSRNKSCYKAYENKNKNLTPAR
ncbi:hypothetical protein Pcinc_002250 [Petrolisthes cinctipes]|uniref:Uncharacterized protein n=1 Tax=Petrolisthes cinctipes TaxID=88211 RepID=A0AAE1GLC0_PETCI|nr:hypothetical protein Pcinc_002250 [Petrolisthes cinctipes]